MSFESLGLMAELQRAVSEKGYSSPTPIQKQAIPAVLEGRDLMGGAQTGTGKTAGFTLPLLQRLMETAPAESKPLSNKSSIKKSPGSRSGKAPQRSTRRPIRALVLTPTRELAAQVADSVKDYGRHLPLRSTVVFGGVSINPQKQKLIRGVDILIATPGRLLDHVNQRSCDLSSIDILVLDEADRMLDMGFIHDIKKVLALVPKQKQTLLFSATFSDDIKKLANGLMRSPVLVEVARQNAATESVTQVIHPVDKSRKRELLSFLIGSNNWQQVLVFTRTKHGANRLAQQLDRDGITSAAIHGNKSQGARTRALADFKAGKVRVLVATDIAARGIDIDQLPHVVNYELPNVAEDYVHRIGRTGRAGNEGEAMSLVCVDELKLLKDIEKLIKREIPKTVIDGYEPDPSIKAEPITRGRGQPGRRPAKTAGKQSPGKKSPRPGKNARNRNAAAGNVKSGDTGNRNTGHRNTGHKNTGNGQHTANHGRRRDAA
jgi:ATP-dependent RNA helicase RhlE